MERRLRLSRTNKLIAGVCGGIGEYFRIDPTLIRIAVAILFFASLFVPVTLFYVLLWAIIPLDN